MGFVPTVRSPCTTTGLTPHALACITLATLISCALLSSPLLASIMDRFWLEQGKEIGLTGDSLIEFVREREI